MSIVLTKRAGLQPYGTVHARRDLSFAVNLTSLAPPDVARASGPIRSSDADLVTSHDGQTGVKLLSGTATALTYPNTNALFSSAYEFTVIFAGTIAAEARRGTVWFYGDESGGGFDQHAFCVNSSGTGGNSSGLLGAFTYEGGFSTQVVSSAGVIDGDYHVFGWRNTASGTLWRDGVDVTASTSGGGATAGLAAAYPTYLLNTDEAGNNRGCKSPVHGVWVFPRLLSLAEMVAYTRDPWQLFTRPARRHYLMQPQAAAASANHRIIGGGWGGRVIAQMKEAA